MQYEIESGDRTRQVRVQHTDAALTVSVDGKEWPVDASRIDAQTLSLLIGHRSYEATIAADPATGHLLVRIGAATFVLAVNGRRRWGRGAGGQGGPTASGPQRIAAPMPGKTVRVLVKQGDAVSARQPLVVVEAMKMENEVRAPRDGIVSEVHAREGASVDAGTLLIVIT